jgi:hypothetical protein
MFGLTLLHGVPYLVLSTPTHEGVTMAENKTVARAQRKADRFAEIARLNPNNTVEVKVEDSRLIPSGNLTRSITVTVTDQFRNVTTASWTVDVEQPTYGRRSTRFFGYGYGTGEHGRRISESTCWHRISRY